MAQPCRWIGAIVLAIFVVAAAAACLSYYFLEMSGGDDDEYKPNFPTLTPLTSSPSIAPSIDLPAAITDSMQNISILPVGSYVVDTATFSLAPIAIACNVSTRSDVEKFIGVDDSSTIMEAGRLFDVYVTVPPAITTTTSSSASAITSEPQPKTTLLRRNLMTESVVGIGIQFGSNSVSSTALSVIPLTGSSGVKKLGTLADGSAIYQLKVNVPSSICTPNGASEYSTCTAVPYSVSSITSNNGISSRVTARTDVSCGDVCSQASACSVGCSKCDAGGIVAGADIDMGFTSGQFDFQYETYSVPDRIKVWNDGKLLLDTGCVGSNGKTSLSYAGSSSIIRVDAEPLCTCGKGGQCSGTAWNFQASCAKASNCMTVPPRTCSTSAASNYDLGRNGLNMLTFFEGLRTACYKVKQRTH
jgi:hypothetical protein